MLPPDLERNHAVVAEVDRLHHRSPLQIPEVQAAAVLARDDILDLEPVEERVRRAPLTGDQRVLPGLVPKVVHELLAARLTLPALEDREVARVEHGEPARQVSVRVPEHRDRDDVARHAVNGVGRAQPELFLDLLALDDVLDPRGGRIGDVEDVDPRGAHPRNDQRVAAQLRMARRRARVPTEVMQLIPDVWHLRAMHDLAVARRRAIDVDDRNEVRPGDPRPLVQSSDIDELLGRLLARHLR